MKILRVRRGFTTNSSSYTEWLPPPSGGSGQSTTPPAATASGTAPAQPPTAPPPVAAHAPLHGATAAPPAQQGASPVGPHLAGNTATVLGILAALAAAFLGERLFRRLRRTDEEHDREDDE